MKKTILTLFAAALFINTQAQDLKTKPNWQNLDFEKDSLRGMSVERAYSEILKGKSTKTVIVGIIDSGIDIKHEDLQGKFWVNEKEIAGNGKDDDGNGFVDDINGWDFIGGADGTDINQEQVELTRLLKKYTTKFGENPKKRLIRKNKAEYELYQEIKKEYEEKSQDGKNFLPMYKQMYQNYQVAAKTLKDYLKTETINESVVDAIDDAQADRKVRAAKQFILKFYEMGATESDLRDAVQHYEEETLYNYNLDFDARKVVGDKLNELQYGGYGNNEVTGPDAMHGTHVAGIIGANRNNDLGINGVATDVKIMVIRAVPNGDERDKDVANAIRYAADNGASIVNMSFGKKYSPEKKWVDDAVKYAQSKGVLLIAAAGNDNLDIDTDPQYPMKKYNDKKEAENWITVGALSWKDGKDIVANFSNYGQVGVDVFAPGVDIYSSVPNSKYEEKSGTSMAAPAVTGVAALLKSYFPALTATQIKKIILESSVKIPSEKVYIPGSQEIVKFGELSNTGGIVNAYQAIKMAEEMSK